MTTALLCLDGYRVPAFLDAAAATLAPSLSWLLVHVADTRPVTEIGHALDRLPGRGPGRDRAERRLHHAAEWDEAEVRAAVASWLKMVERDAALLVTRGRPEREIVRIAEERAIDLVVLGGGRGLAGRYPGPGQYPLSPVARYVVDHARCDVVLLRRYVETSDRLA